MGSWLAVEVTTTSNCARRSGRSASRIAVPRFSAAPAALQRAVGDGGRCRFLCGEIFGTQFYHLARRREQHILVLQVAKIRCASFTEEAAMDKELAPNQCECALPSLRRMCAERVYAARCQRASMIGDPDSLLELPRISGSPSTMESRPAATRKACLTASCCGRYTYKAGC